ncbi:MAG TPA: hypothetical protein VFJ03_00420 [Candidatus Limnocylindria bacterium]|nr:hypothetical protein [Candidatus Limnocylindria bacterium]
MIAVASLLLPLILLFAWAVAVCLLVAALLLPDVRYRWRRVALVPLAGGLLLALLTAALFRQASSDVVSQLAGGGLLLGPLRISPLATWGLVAAVVLAAAAVVYFAALAFPRGIAGWRGADAARRAWIGEVIRIVLVGALVLGVVGTTFATQRVVVGQALASANGAILHTLALPGSPTGLALDGRSGYVTFGEGQIAYFTLGDDDATISTRIVADGLSFPRGAAIADGNLFVVDMGRLACPDPFPQCWTPEPAEELQRLNASSASIKAYPILDNGDLGQPRTVIDGLPVVNSEHSPNVLTLGPDGFLYLAIGGPDRLPFAPELLQQIDHPKADLLGTVARFDPRNPKLQIVARGIRNIYTLAFDPAGDILGVDNDGQAVRGWHSEQLTLIRPGVDYGFPREGTFGRDVPPPLWLVDSAGSAGLAWADTGDVPGVLIGSFGKVQFVPLLSDDEGPYVPNLQQVRDVTGQLPGYVTAIDPLGGDRYLLAQLDPGGTRNALLIMQLKPVD